MVRFMLPKMEQKLILDLGHYERFIDENLDKYSNLTTGKVYWNVLNKERQGKYLGSNSSSNSSYY